MSFEINKEFNNDFVDGNIETESGGDFGRLGKKGWNRMEKPLEGTDAKVVKALDGASNGNKTISNSNSYKTFGETIYVNIIRPELNNLRPNIVDLKKHIDNIKLDADKLEAEKKKKKSKPGQGGKVAIRKLK